MGAMQPLSIKSTMESKAMTQEQNAAQGGQNTAQGDSTTNTAPTGGRGAAKPEGAGKGAKAGTGTPQAGSTGAATGTAATKAKDESGDPSADLRRNHGVFYQTLIPRLNERLSDKPLQIEWEGKPVVVSRLLADGTIEVRPATGGDPQVITQIQPEHVMAIFKHYHTR